MYIYPENLRAKPTLWLWQLKDIGIIGAGCLISAIAVTQIKFVVPAVLTATYAFLSIRFDDTSILDFIKYASSFFFRQQHFEWGWVTCKPKDKS